jgi:hypothetical protein
MSQLFIEVIYCDRTDTKLLASDFDGACKSEQ